MNAKFEVAILRTHSDYMTHLATELSTTLKALEQLLSEAPAPHATVTAHAERLAEVQRLLTTEANMFCGRLEVFLTQTLPKSRLVAAPSTRKEPE
jgi:hypothetical protein